MAQIVLNQASHAQAVNSAFIIKQQKFQNANNVTQDALNVLDFLETAQFVNKISAGTWLMLPHADVIWKKKNWTTLLNVLNLAH